MSKENYISQCRLEAAAIIYTTDAFCVKDESANFAFFKKRKLIAIEDGKSYLRQIE